MPGLATSDVPVAPTPPGGYGKVPGYVARLERIDPPDDALRYGPPP